jgi:hypothetical protein
MSNKVDDGTGIGCLWVIIQVLLIVALARYISGGITITKQVTCTGHVTQGGALRYSGGGEETWVYPDPVCDWCGHPLDDAHPTYPQECVPEWEQEKF